MKTLRAKVFAVAGGSEEERKAGASKQTDP